MRRRDLLVLGELNPDVVVAGADEVAFGQVESLVDDAVLTLGSSGAITAAAAAAQGLDVAFCGVVGSDPVGALVIDLLAARGVDVSGVVHRADVSTGMTVVLTRADGDRAMLTHLGAMSALRTSDIDPDLLAGARHVHVSSIFLQRSLQDGLDTLMRDLPGTTSLDPGWDPAQDWSAARNLLPVLDFLLPNAAECTRIARDPDVLSAAAALHRQGPVVALKNGGDGAVLADADGVRTVATDLVVPVDTTGAGDNFNAGFLAATLDGAPHVDAILRAVASGSISVTGRGGTGRMASRDEAVAGAARLRVGPLLTTNGDRR